jgi:CBS domain-containing protein
MESIIEEGATTFSFHVTMLKNTTAFASGELQSAIIRNPLTVEMGTKVIDAIGQMSGIRTACDTTEAGSHLVEQLYLRVRSSCVLVVEAAKVVGILTERDIVRLTAQQQPLEQLRVEEVMGHPVISLPESAFRISNSNVFYVQEAETTKFRKSIARKAMRTRYFSSYT